MQNLSDFYKRVKKRKLTTGDEIRKSAVPYLVDYVKNSPFGAAGRTEACNFVLNEAADRYEIDHIHRSIYLSNYLDFGCTAIFKDGSAIIGDLPYETEEFFEMLDAFNAISDSFVEEIRQIIIVVSNIKNNKIKFFDEFVELKFFALTAQISDKLFRMKRMGDLFAEITSAKN